MEWLPRHKSHYFRNILQDIAHNPLKRIAALALELETIQELHDFFKPNTECLFIFDKRRKDEEEIKWIQ